MEALYAQLSTVNAAIEAGVPGLENRKDEILEEIRKEVLSATAPVRPELCAHNELNVAQGTATGGTINSIRRIESDSEASSKRPVSELRNGTLWRYFGSSTLTTYSGPLAGRTPAFEANVTGPGFVVINETDTFKTHCTRGCGRSFKNEGARAKHGLTCTGKSIKSQEIDEPAADNEHESDSENEIEGTPILKAAKVDARKGNRGAKHRKRFCCVFKLTILDQIRWLKQNGNRSG